MNIFRFLPKYSRIFAGIIPYFSDEGRTWRAENADEVHVDLEKYVVDYVWPKFIEKVFPFHQRLFINRRDYLFEISWNHLEFRDCTEIEDCFETSAKVEHEEKNNKKVDENNEGSVKEQYLTEYTNVTDTVQTYNFKHSAEKFLRSSLELQSRYTLGKETNLTVDICKIANFGSESSAVFTVTSTSVREFSELSRFDNATTIKVPPFKKAVAALLIRERQVRCRFKVTTTVKPYDPIEGLPVTVRRKRDDRVLYSIRVANLHHLFNADKIKHCTKIVKLETIEETVGQERLPVDVLRLITRGVCTVVAPKIQTINVRYEVLPKIK